MSIFCCTNSNKQKKKHTKKIFLIFFFTIILMGNCINNNSTLENIKEIDKRLIEKKDLEDFKIKWNLSNKQINDAYKQAHQDCLQISPYVMSINDEMKCFLYAKQVLDDDLVIRNHMLKRLFERTKEEEQKKYERLYRIVSIGEQSKDNASSFDLFVSKHPQWAKGTSWVLFRDHPLLESKNAYVERTQLSRNCYLHAPVVFQHYLVSMSSQEKTGMVDISWYLRKHMDSESLKNHIFFNSGGHSVELLRNLLQLSNHETFEKPDVKSTEIPEMMHKYGPVLVSSMEIWSCFYDQSKQVYTGLPMGKTNGFHALVLVGYRFEGTKIRYLLQNWWKDKAFVECDVDYLRACGVSLTLCTNPQTNIPSTFETNFNRSVEMTSDFECCEYLPLETK